MKRNNKEKLANNIRQEEEMRGNSDMAEDDGLLRMIQSENKLFDVQKEHFNNVRTLITAAAAIAAVDLLALQSLQNIGLANWFLWSVILLYLSSIIFVLYLTLSSNVQTKMLLDRSGMVKEMTDILKDKDITLITEPEVIEAATKTARQFSDKMMRTPKTMQFAEKMIMVGNVLFVVGLFIPIIGFVRSLF